MAGDVVSNGGCPRQVDMSAFTVGENLAATPGKVVFRNELMELIQYAPQTETAYETPLLLSPPWINKYYMMDLAPGRSFAEWAVEHGHTVFAISYRNPDASLRDIALDDYLLHGPHTALDVIGEITGAPQVNIAGLCLGGTLTAMLLAHLAARGRRSRPLGHAAQHADRLLRARDARLVHRRALGAPPRPQDGRDAACSREPRWR